MTDDAVGPTAAGERPSSLLPKGSRVKGLGSLLDGRASKLGAGDEGRRSKGLRSVTSRQSAAGRVSCRTFARVSRRFRSNVPINACCRRASELPLTQRAKGQGPRLFVGQEGEQAGRR